MGSWFSCCYGSRKELSQLDPIQPELGSTASKAASSFSAKRLVVGSSPETAVQSSIPDPMQSYVLGYQSMGTHPLPKSSFQRRSLARQTTEPILKITHSSTLTEPFSAPIVVPIHKEESPLKEELIGGAIPFLHEGSPLQRSSSEMSEPPVFARNLSVVSLPDRFTDVLQKQITSLQTEIGIFTKKNDSLQKEVEEAQEKQAEVQKAKETLEAELENVRKENIKILQRNTQLEKRLAISTAEKEQFLKSPESQTTRRGSLSDIEEEEERGSKDVDRASTLLQVQQELENMRSKYQRAARHLKVLQGRLGEMQRTNNRLEMELQTKQDQVEDLVSEMTRMQRNLDRRDKEKSAIEKREVAVEKAEEHQAQDKEKEKESEKQLQDAEQIVQTLREQGEKLRIQRNEALLEKEQLTEKLQEQQQTLQEQEKQLKRQETMLLEERQKSHSYKDQIGTLTTQLTQATLILAGYTPQKLGSSLKRSASLPSHISKT